MKVCIRSKTKLIDISYWIKSLEENCKEGIIRVLVGNKTDLEDKREVKIEEGKTREDFACCGRYSCFPIIAF